MPVLLGILVATAILLLVGDHAAAFLGLQQFRAQHRAEISLVLVGSLSLLIGRAIVVLWPLAWTKIAPPPQPVVLIPEIRPNALWWSYASHGEKPTQQVVGDFTITNRTDNSLYLPHAVLRRHRWLFFGKSEKGHAGVQDPRSRYAGEYPIPPHAVTSVRLHFIGVVKKKPQPGPFVADVAVVDQFGNHYWLRGLVFKDTALPMEEQ